MKMNLASLCSDICMQSFTWKLILCNILKGNMPSQTDEVLKSLSHGY